MATKKPRAQKSASKGLRTTFMAAFTKEFIGDPRKIDDWPNWPDPPPPPKGVKPRKSVAGPPRLWPVYGQHKNQNDILTDYATFVNVLMTVGYVGGAPPAASAGSLGERIGNFLTKQKWPSKTSVPRKWVNKPGKPAVHLIEIAVILDHLLQAANSFRFNPADAGGGGGGWPPHGPGS